MTRTNNIKVDFGMSDYYKYYSQHSEQPVDAKTFNKIVSDFNKEITNAMIYQNLEFKPRFVQLTLCIRKSKRVPRIDDNGKLINTMPIDYKSTKELWAKDPDAKDKKIVLRYLNNHTGKYVFRIKAIKTGFAYSNKKYYKFKAVRQFARELGKRILNTDLDKFDTYKLY